MRNIDIIIPVYFAPDQTVRCIESVVKTTQNATDDIKIIVSDDSNSNEFHDLLTKLLKEKNILEKVVLIKREANGGFIEACYTGIEYRESDYKILLNSDTITMNGWVEKMVETAESDPKIALVSPITNQTSVINVEMPEGYNINLMHEAITSLPFSNSDYIDVVTVVGFGLLIKSEYIKKYGFFDRIYEKGYGEETDLHFRYTTKGLRAVISPNAFIYHRGEASFSDRDDRLVKNREIFLSRYKEAYIKDSEEFNKKTILTKIREQVRSKRNFDYDFLIFAKSNDLLDPINFLAHKLSNLLNEMGKSAMLVLENKVDRNGKVEDYLYNPLDFDSLENLEITAKNVLFSEDQIDSVIRYISKRDSSNINIAILPSRHENAKIHDLIERLNIESIANLPQTIDLEFYGVKLKHKQNPNKLGLVIYDNKESLKVLPNTSEIKYRYIYAGRDSSEPYAMLSETLSEGDIYSQLSESTFIIDLRKISKVTDLHLNLAASGNIVVSDYLINDEGEEFYTKIITLDTFQKLLTSESEEQIPELSTDFLVSRSSRMNLYQYDLRVPSVELTSERLSVLLRISSSLESKETNVIVHKIEVGTYEGNSMRLRYRFVDKIVNTFARIPYFYRTLEYFVKGLKKVKRKLLN